MKIQRLSSKAVHSHANESAMTKQHKQLKNVLMWIRLVRYQKRN